MCVMGNEPCFIYKASFHSHNTTQLVNVTDNFIQNIQYDWP